MFKFREGDTEKINSPQTPMLHVYDGNAEELFSQLSDNAHGQLRILEGGRMTTDEEVLHEFFIELNFPSYFGDNYDALHDCLTDLAWIDLSKGLVILIKDVDAIYNANKELFLLVFEMLRDASVYWAIPGDGHESTPVNIILQCKKESSDELYDLLEDKLGFYFIFPLNDAWNDPGLGDES